jgi:hypothetical protein
MGVVGAVARHFVDTVTVEPFLGRDKYAQPSFGAPRDVAARVEYTPRLVRTIEGREVVGSTVVYTADQDITADDRLTLPDGKQPVILSIEKARALDGTMAVMVVC